MITDFSHIEPWSGFLAGIESKISESDVFLFVAWRLSSDAQGQHRELSLAFAKIRVVKTNFRAFPVVLDDVGSRNLLDELAAINGVRLDAYSVKSTVFIIAKTFFLEFFASRKIQEWTYPRPGQWEVCQVDPWIEKYFDLRDRVYFRRFSPLSLFECYSTKLDGLSRWSFLVCA